MLFFLPLIKYQCIIYMQFIIATLRLKKSNFLPVQHRDFDYRVCITWGLTRTSTDSFNAAF